MAKAIAFLRALARVARGLSLAAALAAGLLVVALYDEGWRVAVALVAIAPAVVLWLFSAAVNELADLPERLRGAPAQAADLRAALEDVGRRRGAGRMRALLRAGRRAVAVRETATPWVPLLPLASLPFLAAAAISALAVPGLVLLAVVVLIVYG